VTKLHSSTYVQFAGMKQQGTGIIVLYNLWEDDQGQLELDFDADQYVSDPHVSDCSF
jgi:hypothetical protein